MLVVIAVSCDKVSHISTGERRADLAQVAGKARMAEISRPLGLSAEMRREPVGVGTRSPTTAMIETP